jgi:hypothetical protein
MKTVVLFRTLAQVFRGLAALKVTVTVRFHRPVRVKEVAVLRVLFLLVLPTIKEIQNYILLFTKELYSVPLLLVHNSLV